MRPTKRTVKARQFPLRGDLAADLRSWIAGNVKAEPSEAVVGCGRVVRLPNAGATPAANTLLFDAPDKLVRILDRHFVAAGIARRVKTADGKTIINKRDERGRTVDVHALRHTFGTLLSNGGAAPRPSP